MTATHRELTPTITITSIRDVRDTATTFAPSGPTVETDETRRIVADVDGAPTLHQRTRIWQPTQFGVTYIRRSGRTWEIDTVSLYGWNIKQDGTLGQQRMRERWWSSTEQPGWLTEFVAENMPPEEYAT